MCILGLLMSVWPHNIIKAKKDKYTHTFEMFGIQRLWVSNACACVCVCVCVCVWASARRGAGYYVCLTVKVSQHVRAISPRALSVRLACVQTCLVVLHAAQRAQRVTKVTRSTDRPAPWWCRPCVPAPGLSLPFASSRLMMRTLNQHIRVKPSIWVYTSSCSYTFMIRILQTLTLLYEGKYVLASSSGYLCYSRYIYCKNRW